MLVKFEHLRGAVLSDIRNPGTSKRFYLAVALICGSTTTLQILQSRIFSVVTWYHLAFLTISIAMFGLTMGALDVYKGSKEEQRRNLGKLLGDSSVSFGLFAVAMLFVQMSFPIVDHNFRSIVITLPLVAGMSAVCYYYAGKVVSLCLTRSSLPVGGVYAADMIGAALGCLVAIALMKLIDAPSAVLIIAGCIIAISFMFYYPPTLRKRISVLALAVGIAGGGMFFQNLHGHAVATVNLYAIIIFSMVASLLVLILPFRKALKLAPEHFIRAGTAYFALIGMGFMFVEITLMQIMSMFLGHQVYALSIVLFSLILSSGIGSFLSELLPLNSRRRIVLWALSIALYVTMLSASIGVMMGTFIEASFTLRVALCVWLIFPCGLMRGFAFPTGMRLTEKVSDFLTPWFWGINGATGVVASAFAVFISIGFGLPVTLMTAALCYGLLAVPALSLLEQSRNTT